ncbi:hypothetical protein [Streptomyces sp. NRRL S-350]|uniref:hypothetical protein n=1 Tax=Streptomyces sp. NRRL S-350 TaxID=1463902 RepID=UPI0004BF171B|nr:hypothetical protein [Streptomyces sp. NRRL S-350]
MYELSRVRMCSAGPAAARFHDVTLDFSGVGRPVAQVQEDLFTTPAHLLRPSPASVLFLENGGGKSVFLKLLFSVVLPGQQRVKDAPDPQLLKDFVLAKDVCHIALEWMNAVTGRLLVTAKVLGWKDGVVSSDPEKFMEECYAFRPTEALGLDSLPIVENGKYLALPSYRNQMKELFVQNPRLELDWPSTQTAWNELLGQLGLDPELFRYQRVMNKDEGEAVHAFAMASDGRFVEFLLEAVFEDKGLTDLADLVSTYSHKLAGRKDLLLELQFVERAMALLEPVIEAATAVNGSRLRSEQAQQEMAAFHGQVRTRVRAESDRVALLERSARDLTEAHTQASGVTRRWAATVARQQQVLAQLRHDLAKEVTSRTEHAVQEAKDLVAGWGAIDAVQRHLTAAAAAQELKTLVRDVERAAEPALAARDRCARALAQALLRLRDRAQKEQADLGAKALDETTAETRAREARDAELRKAEQAAIQAKGLLEQVGDARTGAAQAVTDGLAATIDLVPQAAVDARQAVHRTKDKISALEREEEEVDRKQSKAQEALTAAVGAEATALAQYDQARKLADTAASRTAAIEATPRLAELLGAAVRLDQDALVLVERLNSALAQAEQDSGALQVEQARDELTRTALRNGALLPPPEVVQDACRLLGEAEPSIVAWPGWEYLADFDIPQRQEMLARAPHLAAGVLLNSVDDSERAQQILLGQAVATGYYIAVGTAAGLVDATGNSAKDMLFTLPFDPALYDMEAAEAERQAVEERWSRSTDMLRDLRVARQRDTKLQHTITAWRVDYPVGAPDALEGARTDAGKVAAEAERAVAEQRLILKGLAQQREQIRDDLHDAREDYGQRQQTEHRLTRISDDLAQIPVWLEQAEQANGTQRAHLEQATKDLTQAEEHRRLAQGHRDASDERRRTAAQAALDWSALPGADELRSEEGQPDDPVAVPVLRDAYEKAKANFDSAAVPAELQQRLLHAEAAARDAAQTYSGLPEAARDRARQLLKTPQGMDKRSQTEGQLLAQRAQTAAEHALGRANREQGQHQTALDGQRQAFLAQTADGTEPMPVAWTSDTIDDCVRSVEAAQAEHCAAREAEATALAQQQGATEELTRAKEAMKEFEQLIRALAGTPAGPGEADPYVGDSEASWADYERINGTAKEAKEALARYDAQLRGTTERLTQHAASTRYARLTIPVRQQIIEIGTEQIAHHAEHWLAELTPRRRNLADDISQVDQHRQTIVEHLKGVSDKALSLLRSAQRLSRLPQSLTGWGGQEFLQFAFQRQADELLLPRLGELAEEAAAGQTSDGRKVARDGLSLLLRAVNAAVPAGFRVHILKPDKVIRGQRERVSKVKEVFSGGQQLTAAILLYCTMAALRANQQGRERSRYSGVLFLDNPIGRANAEYLLDLQREVAHALGVQLVYTTGLFDEGALGKFPLIIRLRNDADLRAARRYLVVDEVISRHLDGLAPDDGTGRIDSARIFRREEPRDIPEGDDGATTPGE